MTFVALFLLIGVLLFTRSSGIFILAIVCLIVLFGCGTSDPFVSEWNQAATIENWARCNDNGYIKIHVDHVIERERQWSMRDDLIKNNCRRQLGSLWVDKL